MIPGFRDSGIPGFRRIRDSGVPDSGVPDSGGTQRGDKKDEILTFYMNFFFDFSILKKVSFTIDIRVIKI